MKEIRKWAKSNLSYSLHKSSRRIFERNKLCASEIYSLWDTNLAFVQDVAKENDGVNYLLVLIDVFSKYVWVRPMKNKTVHGLLEAFDSVFSEGRKPEKLRTDRGTEFLNESFQQYLKKKDIEFCTANNNAKASAVERVNRTFKSKLYCYFTVVNSLCTLMQVSISPVTIPPGTPGLLHRNVCPALGLLHNRKCPGAGTINDNVPGVRHLHQHEDC